MGHLTTHILDTAHGQPAAGVAVRLFSLQGQRSLLTTLETNEDGRTDAPLLEGETMQAGTYELEFDIGDYFAARGVIVSEPPFLNTVVIRFAVNPDEHYHVPLLASPWSYSTYRGS
jgi:5-hydroxyisourate hydrolase